MLVVLKQWHIPAKKKCTVTQTTGLLAHEDTDQSNCHDESYGSQVFDHLKISRHKTKAGPPVGPKKIALINEVMYIINEVMIILDIWDL